MSYSLNRHRKKDVQSSAFLLNKVLKKLSIKETFRVINFIFNKTVAVTTKWSKVTNTYSNTHNKTQIIFQLLFKIIFTLFWSGKREEKKNKKYK